MRTTTKPEARHTPGPWRVKTYPGTLQYAKVFGPPHPIDGGDYAPLCETSNEADAQLIAKAPELLEALRDLLKFSETWQGSSVEIVKARAAIAKAEGTET